MHVATNMNAVAKMQAEIDPRPLADRGWSTVGAHGLDFQAPRGGAQRDLEHMKETGELPNNRRTQRAIVQSTHRVLGKSNAQMVRERRDKLAARRHNPSPPQAEDYFDREDGEALHRKDLVEYARQMNKRKALRRLRGGR